MEEDESSGWTLPDLGRMLTARWPQFVLVTTVAGFLAGVDFFEALYGRFGLDSLVFSETLPTYLLAGGVSVFFFLLVVGLTAILMVAVQARLQVPKASRAPSRAGRRAATDVVLVADLFVLCVLFWFSWRWLVPLTALLPAARWAPPPWLVLILLLLVIVLTVMTAGVVMFQEHRRMYHAFGFAFLLIGAPVLSFQAGNAEANAILDNLDGHTRARVWWNESSLAPEGYVVIHQDGNVFYLLQQTTQKPDGARVFHTTVVDASKVYRIVLVPPGVDAAEALVNAT